MTKLLLITLGILAIWSLYVVWFMVTHSDPGDDE